MDFIYDIETYPNYFLLLAKQGEEVHEFEISWVKNDLKAMIDWLFHLKMGGHRMVVRSKGPFTGYLKSMRSRRKSVYSIVCLTSQVRIVKKLKPVLLNF